MGAKRVRKDEGGGASPSGDGSSSAAPSGPTVDSVHIETALGTDQGGKKKKRKKKAAAVAKANDDAKQSGVMVALHLDPADAAILAMEGGEPADNLHCTLAYLGKVQNLPADVGARVMDAVQEICGIYGPVLGTICGTGLFDPSPGSEGKFVLNALFSAPVVPALRQALVDAIQKRGIDVKANFGYIPHITLKYFGPEDGAVPANPVQLSKPLVFQSIGVTVAGERTDVPLVGQRVAKDMQAEAPTVEMPECGVNARAQGMNPVELAQWATEHGDLEATPELGGLRGCLCKVGEQVALKFDGDATSDQLAKWIPLRQFLLAIPTDFWLDVDVGVERDGKRVPAADLGALLQGETNDLGPGGQLIITLWDIGFVGDQPCDQEPLSKRRERLELFYRDQLMTQPEFRLMPARMVHNAAELLEAVPWAFGFPESQGLVLRGWNSVYPATPSTPDWAFLARTLEMRARVLTVAAAADGQRIYGCGVAAVPGQSFSNQSDGMVDLGLTMPSQIEAAAGDVLSVEVLGVARDTQRQSLTWVGAEVRAKLQDADPWTVDDVDQAARRVDCLIIKAADRRIVYGVVLRPNFQDSQADSMTPEEVEKAAHFYLEHARVLGFRHKGRLAGAVLESYIAPCDFSLGSGSVKKGDWVLVVRIDDQKVWTAIKEGELTGFSVGGFGTRQDA